MNIPSTRNTKSHIVLPKANKQPYEAGMNQKPSKASKQAAASMAQPTFQFIDVPVMVWSVDDSCSPHLRCGTQMCVYNRSRACQMQECTRQFLDGQVTRVC